jgi:phosphotransferase system  glucose/maltose/N-acetylglucosamine-specific IIC component
LRYLDKQIFFASGMKHIFSILLLLITAFYVLPAKYSNISKEILTEQSNADKAEDCEELKKDTGKEFITHIFSFYIFTTPAAKIALQQLHTIPLVHHTIETPPPNRI